MSRLSKGMSCALALFASCAQVPDSVQSDFDFNLHAFTFANYGTDARPSEMNVALAARMFGREAVCTPETVAGDCEPNAAAVVWLEQINQTLVYGHSEGMAVTSLLMSLGKVNPADFGGPTASALSVENDALAHELAYWAATQGLDQVHEQDVRFAAKDVMPFLAKALKPGSGEGWRLLVAIRDERGFKGGHALVPFGYFKGERDGLYYLRLYDSNMPQAEQRLTIDVNANTWEYEGSFNDQLTRTYEGNTENGNLLWFSPVTSRLGTLKSPFGPGSTLMVVSARASAGVTGAGTSIGFQDGKLVEQGGKLYPAAADCLCKLPNEVTSIFLSPDAGTGEQKVSISTTGLGESSTVYVQGGGVIAKAEGVKADKGNDSMTVDPGGKKVTYETGGDSNLKLTTTIFNDDNTTTVVQVTVNGSSKAVTVDAKDPKNVKVSLDDLPAGTEVTVTTVEYTSSGATTTTTKATTTGGKDAEITVNATSGESVVNTNINFEPCLNAKKDGNESDIDCGLACAGKPANERHYEPLCEKDKTCGADTDCVSGNCIAGVCKTTTCTDARKNGTETDVECRPSDCM